MSAKPLSGLEKAAVLLKSLSPAIVEKVLAHLEPKQSKLLTAEISKLASRPDLKEMTSGVLDEAVSVLVDHKQDGVGKPQPAPPAAAAEADKSPQVNLRIAGTPEVEAVSDADPVAALGALAPELLVLALESENARTIALLMNRLEVDVAGQIFKRLTSAKRKDVSLRLTDAVSLSDELLKHLARAVLKKCQSLRVVSSAGNEQGEREKRMAGLLRNLERAERLETLTALEESDAALAGRIKALLYLFEDILRMENSSIQKLLSEIDMKALAAALFGAQPELQERIMTNLSRRAQESLREEIDLTGKVPAAKVKQSRLMLEEAMQRLDQRGEFLLME